MALKIAVVYATWHGHVREIAAYLANVATARSAECQVLDVRAAEKSNAVDGCDAVVVAGSVHFGRHQRSLRRFVRRSSRLQTIPSAFVSVSDAAASLEGREKAEQYAREFLDLTGWRPDVILLAAGAAPYTRYDPLTRLAMTFAARIAGRGTDVSRDYVYTNWHLVGVFMHDFMDRLERYTVTRPDQTDLTGVNFRCEPRGASSP